MQKPWPLLVGLRYIRARQRNRFASFNTVISVLGVALGVAALITVLSVMNGFGDELRRRILGVVSHVTVTGWQGALENWPVVADKLGQMDEVVGVAPYVDVRGLLAFDGQTQGVLVRGIEPGREGEVSDLVRDLSPALRDALQPGDYRIILGSELALALGARMGDRVTLLTPQTTVTPAGVLPRMKRFTVAGVFRAGMHEYDSALAFVALRDAQRIARLGDRVSGLRLRVADLLRAPWVARAVSEANPELAVSDWTRQNVNFFRAVRTEKIMMFLILLLIVAVAAFNIIATLVMVVSEKRGDIAILRTMGATPAGVMVVFIVQGGVIGLLGTLLGVAGGSTLALNLQALVPALERLLGIDLWPADVYYISELPSQLHWSEVASIAAVSFTLCLLATIYPAWQAARIDPAQALSYE